MHQPVKQEPIEGMLAWLLALLVAEGVWEQQNPCSVTCGTTTSVSIQITCTGPTSGIHLYEASVGTAASIATMPYSAVTSTEASIAIGDLKPSTTYHFKMRTHSSASGTTQMINGWSAFSTPIACSTSASPSGAPYGIGLLARTVNSLTISWNQVQTVKTPSFTVSYRQVDTTMSTWNTLKAYSRTATLKGLDAGSRYEISVACNAKGGSLSGGSLSDTVSFSTPRVNTLWIEVFRVTENMKTFPDYLANHNSGSADGDVAFLTGSGGGNASRFFNFSTSPRVRYCVEIEKVDLKTIPRTPSGPVEIPTNFSFSEYLSCNGQRNSPDPYQEANYTCICSNHIDRVIAHQSPDQLAKYCNGTGRDENTCHCDAGSVA
jgi:hypothetical protein